ncbi:hypothetical protein GKA01_22350 [Gluconobacter kanchanaburiensis NBRC 103587]|uniref:Uncharacterized protein n=1 Tax=Gluconobacter kanchanaburiensis NBRC 103587 TaxID=1307948 RepID=A0A511B9D6_9PROT|nr:hypothetical protein AA103587_1229 [Gluconobacter kanchanaburiensis NBRC 103587]GEK97038.1 hypothetical protein GKA01_22350 [Gluconobacter kanchanaburiensis NBRC 103587]
MTLEPRFLNCKQSAAYIGIGVHVFNQEVKLGIWPQPHICAPNGGRLTWDRKLLDLYADLDSGIGVATPGATSAAFPTQAGLSHYLAKNMSATLTRNRAERRTQEARRRQHH